MLQVLRAEEIPAPESDDMKLKNHDAVTRRDGYFMVDPRELKIDENYNVREMDSPETVAQIEWLKATIADSGVRTPLEVRLSGDDIYIVSGHCRHAAVMALIAEGHSDLKMIPAVPERAGTDEAERALNLHLSNTTNPLSAIAKAKIVKRLEDFGWKHADIARRMGWKATNSVRDALRLLELTPGTKDDIAKGNISASLARNIAKGVDPVEAEKIIRANLEENRRIKGKNNKSSARTKVTAKTMKRDAPKAKAPEPPKAEATAPETPDAMPMPETHTATIHPPTETMTSRPENGAETWAAPNTALARELNAPRHAVKEIFDAIAPVIAAIDLNDLNEIADDATVHLEITGQQAKRLSSLHAQRTGGADAS